MLLEAIEGAGPAALMAFPLLDGLERFVAEGHQRLAVPLRERHRDQGFEAALAFLLPREGKDEAFRRCDFTEHATQPEVPAVLGPVQAVAPAAARSHIHLNMR